MTDIFSFSDKGPRIINQDSIKIEELIHDELLLCLADGVGGNNGGEIASSLAIKVFIDAIKKNNSFSVALELSHMEIVNSAVEPENNGMATTFTAVKISGNEMYGIHCGDSRCYVLRDNGIKQLTNDHREVVKLFHEGKISREDIGTYPRKNVLYSALGIDGKLTYEEFHFDLKPDDRVVLLSDGVYEKISKIEFRDISIASSTANEFGLSIVESVQRKEPRDNYSLIVYTHNHER